MPAKCKWKKCKNIIFYLQFCSNSTWTGSTSDWSGIAILETEQWHRAELQERQRERASVATTGGFKQFVQSESGSSLCPAPREKRRVEPLPRGVRLQPRCLPESAAGLMLSHSERSRDARMTYRWQHSYKRTRSLKAWDGEPHSKYSNKPVFTH